jgi:Arc-like DNA binding dprotein
VVEDMKQKTGRDSDQFILRFPEGMRKRISSLADANGRSMNARLKISFEIDRGLDAVREKLKVLEPKLGEHEERLNRKKRDRD